MAGMLVGRAPCGRPIINFLRALAPGNAMVFDPGESPDLRRRQIRTHVIEIEVEPDVAVEIAIARIAGVPFVPAPDLFGRIEVASEGSNAVRREDRREHAVAR